MLPGFSLLLPVSNQQLSKIDDILLDAVLYAFCSEIKNWRGYTHEILVTSDISVDKFIREVVINSFVFSLLVPSSDESFFVFNLKLKSKYLIQ